MLLNLREIEGWNMSIIDKFKKIRKKHRLLTRVSRANINNEISHIAGNLYKVGVEKAKAEHAMDMAEIALKIKKAKAGKKYRNTGKKKSEAQIKELVDSNKKVVAARKAHADAKYYHSICFSAVTSQTQKGQQITNLAYNYRKEMDQRSYVKKLERDNESKIKGNK